MGEIELTVFGSVSEAGKRIGEVKILQKLIM